MKPWGRPGSSAQSARAQTQSWEKPSKLSCHNVAAAARRAQKLDTHAIPPTDNQRTTFRRLATTTFLHRGQGRPHVQILLVCPVSVQPIAVPWLPQFPPGLSTAALQSVPWLSHNVAHESGSSA